MLMGIVKETTSEFKILNKIYDNQSQNRRNTTLKFLLCTYIPNNNNS